MTQCAKDLKLDLTLSEIWKQPQFKCFLKCTFEKDGFIKDEAFLEIPFIKSIQDDKDLDTDYKAKLIKVVPECLEDVKGMGDICVKYLSFADCLHKSSM